METQLRHAAITVETEQLCSKVNSHPNKNTTEKKTISKEEFDENVLNGKTIETHTF